MTLTIQQIGLYAGALVILFMTPGPVWLALLARGISGGFRATWPLALGVAIGDMIWPLLAILGASALTQLYAGALTLMRIVGAGVFIAMGLLLIRHADKGLSEDKRLTRPGFVAGFLAGLLVILGNPKAILFYMGMLPGFFDLTRITTADIVVIAGISALVPLVGNTGLGLFVGEIRRLLARPGRLRIMNLSAGVLMVVVGLAIAIF